MWSCFFVLFLYKSSIVIYEGFVCIVNYFEIVILLDECLFVKFEG